MLTRNLVLKMQDAFDKECAELRRKAEAKGKNLYYLGFVHFCKRYGCTLTKEGYSGDLFFDCPLGNGVECVAVVFFDHDGWNVSLEGCH